MARTRGLIEPGTGSVTLWRTCTDTQRALQNEKIRATDMIMGRGYTVVSNHHRDKTRLLTDTQHLQPNVGQIWVDDPGHGATINEVRVLKSVCRRRGDTGHQMTRILSRDG